METGGLPVLALRKGGKFCQENYTEERKRKYDTQKYFCLANKLKEKEDIHSQEMERIQICKQKLRHDKLAELEQAQQVSRAIFQLRTP